LSRLPIAVPMKWPAGIEHEVRDLLGGLLLGRVLEVVRVPLGRWRGAWGLPKLLGLLRGLVLHAVQEIEQLLNRAHLIAGAARRAHSRRAAFVHGRIIAWRGRRGERPSTAMRVRRAHCPWP